MLTVKASLQHCQGVPFSAMVHPNRASRKRFTAKRAKVAKKIFKNFACVLGGSTFFTNETSHSSDESRNAFVSQSIVARSHKTNHTPPSQTIRLRGIYPSKPDWIWDRQSRWPRLFRKAGIPAYGKLCLRHCVSNRQRGFAGCSISTVEHHIVRHMVIVVV